jgi:hypothetical protein
MESSMPARGIIVANEITADLKLACTRIPDVRLIGQARSSDSPHFPVHEHAATNTMTAVTSM